MTKPLVSIVCITYNHQNYIEQTIRSFLNQKRDNFDLEIVIADDASTDETQKIIKKYAKESSVKFNAMLRRINVGVGENLRQALVAAKGDYIATCEGDDYWTDSSKLELQVAFMESHDDYSLCFHRTRVLYEDKSRDEYEIPAQESGFSLEGLIKGNYIHTSSVMYRRGFYDDMPTDMLPIDWYLNLQHAKVGKIGFIKSKEPMSVYRRNSGSVWFPEAGKSDEFWLKKGIGHAATFEQIRKIFENTEYEKLVLESQDSWTDHLAKLDLKLGSDLIASLARLFPDVVARYTLNKVRELSSMHTELDAVMSDRDCIANSRTWKLRTRVLGIIRKVTNQ